VSEWIEREGGREGGESLNWNEHEPHEETKVRVCVRESGRRRRRRRMGA